MNIRQEEARDYAAVKKLVKEAFETAEHSDGTEQELVEKLRKSGGFISELSLVAEEDGKILGQIIFTKAKIGKVNGLALAPLSVSPKAQGKGVGSALIKKGHEIAKSMGYDIVIVLGSEKYYPKFGYEPASKLGIKAPFDVHDINFMAISLSGRTEQINATVEYVKEIFEGEKIDFKDNGLEAWEKNAQFWDEQMGDESNFFHCDIVRPNVEKLLEINENDFVLDIACGNGNFSQRMAKKGAKVTAFDYSPKMIELAVKRRNDVLDKVSFHVCDATKYGDLLKLKSEKLFTKAVANMAIMDISEISPLISAVFDMLDKDGIFVFATHHPCFTYENDDYFTSCINKGFAIEGQPMLQNYYHRSISDILSVAFAAGFVLDGFCEVPFKGERVPIIMTVRLRKKY